MLIIDLLKLLKIQFGGQELVGNDGVNILAGGAGHDYVEGQGGLDTLSGGSGIDTLSYVSSTAGVNVDIAPGLLGLFITQASGGDATGDIVTADFENLIGSDFNDTLKGTSGANIIAGQAGDDSLYGRDGDDSLIGGAGADHLDGGSGFDIADYSSGTSPIHLVANASGVWTASGGDAQGDTLVSIEKVVGSKGDDLIDGSASTVALNFDGGGGNDTVIGGAGDDVFVVGPGVNNLSGGGGDDTFLFNDAIFESATGDLGTINGGEGITTLSFSEVTGGVEITITEPTITPFMLSEAAGPSTIFIAGPGNTSGTFAYDRSDIEIQGSDGNDTLNGGANADKLFGSAGDDILSGSGGDDYLEGGDDNDTLTGGAGKDYLFGGSGSDIYVFLDVSDSPVSFGDAALDRIMDFMRGQDKIDLSGIDAIVRGADDAFSFIDGAFTVVAGQLHVVTSSTTGYDKVEGDTNGDSTADFAILVSSATMLTATDFRL